MGEGICQPKFSSWCLVTEPRLGDSFKFNSSAKNWASKLESCHGGKGKVELLEKDFSLLRFNISAVLNFKVPGIFVMCIN